MSLPTFKTLGSIAPQRSMPRFAKTTFVEQFRRRPAKSAKKKVLLWPDTFNNHFHPATANAAADVLEAAGYEVIIPRKRLCCGRPRYGWGFLGVAKNLLRATMEALKPELDEGIPIVGLEPRCVSVFRHELPNLFPRHDDAKPPSKAVKTLPEFLLEEN